MGALLLFGATGDLARRMLLPSLYGLDADQLLAPGLKIVGSARSGLDDDGFRALACDALQPHLASGLGDDIAMARFMARLSYVPIDATRAADFDCLAPLAAAHGDDVSIFLSTAPALFGPTIAGLKRAGLAGDNVRLALEKPLGSDLASSCAINDAVAAVFPEARIFRIDHYLGKETVQNLLALRFANALFEPVWNAGAIDHVQITVAETVGLEGRTDFYDSTGALRDMVQNHMLQLLALVAMEPPPRLGAKDVRDEKVKVLRSLRTIDAAHAASHIVLGQYAAGAVDGALVKSYTDDLGRPSTTETFVALKAHVDNWRWKGVPFYLRTGKRMARRRTEILIRFRSVPHSIFEPAAVLQPNQLLISLQPEENIELRLMAKQPGLDHDGIRLREVPLDVGLANAFAERRRRIAYERLLLDLMAGRPTLFVRRDEVEAQWRWIDAIRAGWTMAGLQPKAYAAGSWGPTAAIALAERDGVSWHD